MQIWGGWGWGGGGGGGGRINKKNIINSSSAEFTNSILSVSRFEKEIIIISSTQISHSLGHHGYKTPLYSLLWINEKHQFDSINL